MQMIENAHSIALDTGDNHNEMRIRLFIAQKDENIIEMGRVAAEAKKLGYRDVEFKANLYIGQYHTLGNEISDLWTGYSFLQNAGSIAADMKEEVWIAVARLRLGRNWLTRGYTDFAKIETRDALEVFLEYDERELASETYMQLSLITQKLGNLSASRNYSRRAMEIQKSLGNLITITPRKRNRKGFPTELEVKDPRPNINWQCS